ncbi:MAG: DUF5011 domain-containing protein [Candidatus Paceibacterota bacterium]|jgi:hypothetical protein
MKKIFGFLFCMSFLVGCAGVQKRGESEVISNELPPKHAEIEIERADSTPPVITINGYNPMTMTVNEVYAEKGATAFDDVDGNITGKITTDFSKVNPKMPGRYPVFYYVRDTAGNLAEVATRWVIVQ